MYSSYSTLQRKQLTKQVYTDTQSTYLLVYAPGRHQALEHALENQLHRKFRLVTELAPALTDSVEGVLLVSEDLECTSTALTYFAAALRTGADFVVCDAAFGFDGSTALYLSTQHIPCSRCAMVSRKLLDRVRAAARGRDSVTELLRLATAMAENCHRIPQSLLHFRRELCADDVFSADGKRALILSHELTMTGAPIVLTSAVPVLRSMGGSLTQLIGSDSAYAGISELCRLSENQSYRLAVCIPMTDYRRLIFSGNLQMLLIGLFILFFVVFCCMYFHQHILSPAFRQFEEDRRGMDELQMERQQMQTELSRLADVCRNESVPDAFQTFLEGIPNLTKTERRIFDGYVAGLRSREIVEQLDIKDSTLRFHNKNIYEKLGVSSLKQLQQFAAILNSGGNSAPNSAPDESGPKKAR